MHLSEHYPAFTKVTILVLTNNELAKLYRCEDREVDELAVLTTPELEPIARTTGTNLPGLPDLDAAKQHRREELYHALSERLLAMLQEKSFQEILLCVPEANKNELTAALHPDVLKRVKTVVPKNLASMDLQHVTRILFEA